MAGVSWTYGLPMRLCSLQPVVGFEAFRVHGGKSSCRPQQIPDTVTALAHASARRVRGLALAWLFAMRCCHFLACMLTLTTAAPGSTILIHKVATALVWHGCLSSFYDFSLYICTCLSHWARAELALCFFHQACSCNYGTGGGSDVRQGAS